MKIGPKQTPGLTTGKAGKPTPSKVLREVSSKVSKTAQVHSPVPVIQKKLAASAKRPADLAGKLYARIVRGLPTKGTASSPMKRRGK